MNRGSNEESVIITAVAIRETEKAVRLTWLAAGGRKETEWIPKSQIVQPDTYAVDIGVEQEFELTGWIAQQKGIRP